MCLLCDIMKKLGHSSEHNLVLEFTIICVTKYGFVKLYTTIVPLSLNQRVTNLDALHIVVIYNIMAKQCCSQPL